TGLQVYCNNKFDFSADETLKIVQKLYEQKVVTYPRVDTTFLPDDVYPKVPEILKNLTAYQTLTSPLLGKKIKKSPLVFNTKKVTDHHAIIPTGVQINLPYSQQQVYDIITRRFIAVFYDDCTVSNTVVIGVAAEVTFKTTGKEILEKGWRIVFSASAPLSTGSSTAEKLETGILPNFVKGEKGPHEPSFLEKATKPPNLFSEATLLRAMETAGKQIDDDELRELMKENGIGRPSTRANIIETLFKRKYIVRNKKQILPTQTGIQLIHVIQSELLKSAELTGQWEKQLKEIEKGTYNAGTFIKNMKNMVDHLVYEVRSEKVQANISYAEPAKTIAIKTIVETKGITSEKCPKCKKGSLLKGKTAYGCSEFKSGCDFRLPFSFLDKKISENQYIRLLQKKCTVNLKGFKTKNGETEGLIRFDEQFNLVLEEKNTSTILRLRSATTLSNLNVPDKITCPKCKKGTILKGKTAYGCSNYKNGCDFIFSFDDIRKKAAGQPLSAVLVYAILNGK
ncbi:MAG: DNA topoisomerase III, partial [Gelidibacter sp.]|nr:DNA topoisomerase III [Gelidibacter sp.]